MPNPNRLIKPVVDLLVTLALWAYFLAGYLVFFAPLFLAVLLLARKRAAAYQRLLHLFCRSFFWLMQRLMPQLVIDVDPQVRRLQAAVVVSNHQSYLDPLLMISVFRQQRTIVKSELFRVPIFGWILRSSGYIPAVAGGMQTGLMAERIEQLPVFFADGGVLFVFPEGTRSRDGRIGKFKWGAFKIADRFQVPIEVIFIDGSRRVFRPGRFLFDTCVANTIRIEYLGRVLPADTQTSAALSQRVETVRSMIMSKQNKAPTAAEAP